jgi:hypothetical protein
MGLYDEDIADAAAEIRENGELVTVQLSPGAVEDEEQPWKETEGALLEWDDVPLLYDLDQSSPFLAYIKGTDIPAGAALAYMPGNVPFTPSQEHVVISPSRGQLKIDSVDRVAPGEQTILYILRLVQ